MCTPYYQPVVDGLVYTVSMIYLDSPSTGTGAEYLVVHYYWASMSGRELEGMRISLRQGLRRIPFVRHTIYRCVSIRKPKSKKIKSIPLRSSFCNHPEFENILRYGQTRSRAMAECYDILAFAVIGYCSCTLKTYLVSCDCPFCIINLTINRNNPPVSMK